MSDASTSDQEQAAGAIGALTPERREALAERLRAAGQRVTPQRLGVLAAFAGPCEHLAAEEIYQRVERTTPAMTRSTVYRTLELLRDLHIISETDLGGGVHHYELVSEEPHHHLICSRCGEMIQVDDAALAGLRRHLREVYRFEPVIPHLAIFGLCAACQADRQRPPAPDTADR